nr:M50 family metallopeptidase [Planotetraspora thailandica]
MAIMLVVSYPVGPHPSTLFAVLCCLLAGVFIHVYVHELGHLCAALLVRFRVIEVSIRAGRNRSGVRIAGVKVRLGLFGRVDQVRVVTPPDGRAVPARWIAFSFAGPASNLALAAATYLVFHGHAERLLSDDPALAHSYLVAAIAPGAMLGLANLIPFRVRDGQPSDGGWIFAWIFRPGRSRAQVTRRIRLTDGVSTPTDLDELRARVDAGGPDAILASGALLAQSIRARQLAVDADRLLVVARNPSTDPNLASLIASAIAETRAIELMNDTIRFRQWDFDQARVKPIVEVAELGYARDPERAEARMSLALARVLSKRPAEARDLLIRLNTTTVDSRVQVQALAARAIAELQLGDLAQARRVVNSAGRIDPKVGLLPLARTLVERAEQRAAASAGGTPSAPEPRTDVATSGTATESTA